MTEQVEAILFDMGGTLRRGTNREFSDKVKICQQILGLTGYANDPVDFARLLDRRANAYRKWSKHALVELDEVGFWTQWMLPELATDKLSLLAVEINQIWRSADRSYEVLPDAKETILGLFRAGYRLGLVSNTTSSVEAPSSPAKWGYANHDPRSSLKRQGAWRFYPNGAPILVTCQTGM
jgi:FMN phosphatase YigB (HAD superfamily)